MGTTNLPLERVQALLKIDTGDGSLQDHLVRIVRKLSEGQQENALGQLEKLSHHIKQSSFQGACAPDEGAPPDSDVPAEQKLQKWCQDVVGLVQPSRELAPAEPLACVRSFNQDSPMFRWAGFGFSEAESLQITMSLRRLAVETPALENLRFWGKLLGTNADYYVAEGSLKRTPGKPKLPPLPWDPEYDVEPNGEGANTFTYWVSQGPCSSWTRLPAARRSQIQAAQQVKRLMTGDLDSAVLSVPWFPGTERHLLRSQIARITATCNLSIKGWFEVKENTKSSLQLAGEPPAFDDLTNGETWVHASPCILPNGKTTYFKAGEVIEAYKPEDDDQPPAFNEDQEKQLTDFEAKENPNTEEDKEILLGIAEDAKEHFDEEVKAGFEQSPAWTISTHGDEHKYGDDMNYAVTSVRSRLWPGAVSVAQRCTAANGAGVGSFGEGKWAAGAWPGRFANLYVGYGLKCGSLLGYGATAPLGTNGDRVLPGTCAFAPLVPAEMQDEPPEPEMRHEPNPEEGEDGEDDMGDEDPPDE